MPDLTEITISPIPLPEDRYEHARMVLKMEGIETAIGSLFAERGLPTPAVAQRTVPAQPDAPARRRRTREEIAAAAQEAVAQRTAAEQLLAQLNTREGAETQAQTADAAPVVGRAVHRVGRPA